MYIVCMYIVYVYGRWGELAGRQDLHLPACDLSSKVGSGTLACSHSNSSILPKGSIGRGTFDLYIDAWHGLDAPEQGKITSS